MAGRKQAGDGWSNASRRLAELFRSERLARRRSQESVARQAGLALSTVRKIESNGIQEPGVFTVLALIRALELDIALLLEAVVDDRPDKEAGSITP